MRGQNTILLQKYCKSYERTEYNIIVENLLDISCLKLIYFAHIHSHLNYCSNIFSLLSKKDLIRVQTLHKKNCTSSLSHTASLFLKSAIVPFLDLIQVNALCFMYEYRLNRLPSSFNNSWSLNRDTEMAKTLQFHD